MLSTPEQAVLSLLAAVFCRPSGVPAGGPPAQALLPAQARPGPPCAAEGGPSEVLFDFAGKSVSGGAGAEASWTNLLSCLLLFEGLRMAA